MYFLITKAIHDVTEINTMLKIENLVPRNWPNVKTHNLIFVIKSEDMFLIIPNISPHTFPVTLDLFLLGVTV